MIKKLIPLILIITVFAGCATVSQKKNNTPVTKKYTYFNKTWTNFSYGLYFKNKAISTKNIVERNKNLNEAIKYFNKSLNDNNNKSIVYSNLAECYYFKGYFYKSLQMTNKSLSIDDKNIKAYERKYQIMLRLRNFTDAAKTLQEIVKIHPNKIKIQYRLAIHYYRFTRNRKLAEVNFLKTIQMANKSIENEFYVSNSYRYLSQIYASTKRLDKAIECNTKILAMNPDDIRSLYNITMLAMQKNDYQTAKLYGNKSLKFIPYNAKVHFVLGHIYYLNSSPRALYHIRYMRNASRSHRILSDGLKYELLHRDKKALELLNYLTKLRPSILTLHVAKARIYTRQKNKLLAYNEYVTAGLMAYKKKLNSYARNYFEEALKILPQKNDLYYYIAHTYERENNHAMAILEMKKVLKNKNTMNMHIEIGYFYSLKKDYGNATSHFQKAIDLQPKKSRPYFFMALGHYWNKDYPKAEKYLSKTIAIKNDSEQYFFYLAMVQDKLKKTQKAIKSLKTALKLKPQSARSLNYLGYLYADNNIHITESYKLIQRALSIEPDNGAYRDSLGWVLYRKGLYAEALVELLKAEKLLSKIKSQDSVVFEHIGDTYNKIGNSKKALFYWRKSFKLEKKAAILRKIKRLKNKK